MSQYQRLDDVPSDCPCDWQMGGRKDRKTGRPAKAGTAARGRGSDAESETSVMSGTSSEKRLLAQTRDQLREAGEEALRMASAHETPTETPIYGPGNIFDTGDDGPKDEIATLREANAVCVPSNAGYASTTQRQ